jgi:hypothetical protein
VALEAKQENVKQKCSEDSSWSWWEPWLSPYIRRAGWQAVSERERVRESEKERETETERGREREMHRRSTQTYSVAVYAARQPNPARNRCVRIIGESRTSFEPFRIETFALFQNVPRGDRCVIGCQLSSLELQVCFKFITKRFSIYCIANKLPTQIIHHGVFVPQYHIWQPLLVSSEFSPAVPFKNCRISSSCSSF